MITLYKYLIECGECAAPAGMAGSGIASTPGNTMGTGNPMTPSLSGKPGDVEGSKPGSGDQFTAKSRREKAKKKKKI